MTTPFPAKPDPVFVAVQQGGRFTQPYADYFAALDKLLRSMSTVALAAPTNANAKAAGVPLGGLYTSTADPAPIYVRTV